MYDLQNMEMKMRYPLLPTYSVRTVQDVTELEATMASAPTGLDVACLCCTAFAMIQWHLVWGYVK
jgi:hypothetical protein